MKGLFLVFALLVAGCAPQSTHVFEPTRKINVQAEADKQSGQKNSGNDCYEVYAAKAEECGYSRSMKCKRIRRARDKIGRLRHCKVYWNRDEIGRIMRALGRR